MELCQQAWLSTTPTITQFGFVQQGLDSDYGCWQKGIPTSQAALFFPCPGAHDSLPSTETTYRKFFSHLESPWTGSVPY